MKQTPSDILIVGGGFAGIRAAHRLSRRGRRLRLSITLIDREATHVNVPVLYEVASAFVPWEREGVGNVLREAAGVPFLNVLDGTGVHFIQGSVDRIHPQTRTVTLEDHREHTPDILLLTLGAQTHTFNIPGASLHAFCVKTFHEAAELRHHIVSTFLRHRSSARRVQERALRIVVAGGGSAGVETAAELRLFQQKLAALHRVDPRIPRVCLYEASDTILREYPPFLRRKGLGRLKALGVEVCTCRAISAVHPDRVEFVGGTAVPTDTVVWLCGIRAHDVFLRSGLPVHPRGGLIVNETLEVHGHQNIFAAGDCVYAADPATGQTVPDVAWAALQQGNVAADNILRRIQGIPLISYIPHPRPTLATVGGKYALVHLPPFQYAGSLGWVVKQLADLVYLIHILPNTLAFRSWWKSMRVRVAND